MRYFDSGVLLKLYLSEPNSPQAVTLVRENGGLPPITGLHRLEMKAAIGQKQDRGEISETARAQVLANFESDLAAGVFGGTSPAWAEVFMKAEGLASEHAATNLCRSLDTLHVALALELGATEFCTFDQRQERWRRPRDCRWCRKTVSLPMPRVQAGSTRNTNSSLRMQSGRRPGTSQPMATPWVSAAAEKP